MSPTSMLAEIEHHERLMLELEGELSEMLSELRRDADVPKQQQQVEV
jgi:hypothetical protein